MRADRGDGVLETRLVRIRGRVQGIGYRQVCVRRAQELGVTGWMRNRMSESVEILLQGSPEQVAEMCAWLREGVLAPLVEDLVVTEVKPPFARFDRFEHLSTP